MDERIYRIVMSRPIPDKLIRDLRNAPLLEPHQIREYASGNRTLTPALADALDLLIEGKTYQQIADGLGITFFSAQDRVKRLLALYGAHNRLHLAAIVLRERRDNAEKLAQWNGRP